MLDFFEFDNTFYSATPTLFAREFIKPRTRVVDQWVKVTTVNLDKDGASRLNKPEGKYSTVLSSIVRDGHAQRYYRLVDALANELKRYIRRRKNILVVGLGNAKMTADALGSLVVGKVEVTRKNGNGICTLCPSVYGVTGIESFEMVSAVTRQILPSLIVAVDSLCSANESRLATAFQISDTGIIPGSGTGNAQPPLDKKSLGVEVVSVGVPLVVYASTLVKDANGDESKIDPTLVVTPKDIDLLVEDCADIIAGAINSAVGKF
ncbi:MAG: GPR endopeptidase [Clostridia bacterium]|nr:GPR endopeptidase [Clostridia bacterium]